MHKLVLITSLLFVLIENCWAQSSLVISDAGGTKMGTLVRPVGAGSENIEILTADGYLMIVSPILGMVVSPTTPDPDTIWYSSEDCKGTAYLEANSDWMKHRGGQVLVIGPSVGGTLVTIPWGAAGAVNVASARGLFEPLCHNLDSIKSIDKAVAITTPHPSVYGLKNVDPGFWAFQPPFSAVVEESDIISCNGFESCPVTN